MRSLTVVRVGLCVGAASLGLVVAVAAAQAKGDKVDAAGLYKQRCAMCHGPRGDSKLPGMSFTDGEWKHGSSVKEVADIIRNGVDGTAMLAFKSKLKDPEVEALARHVRAFDPKLKDDGTK